MSREEQFDFYWKEIFDGLAYNPIEFNVYRFDQSMSLPGKVNKLYDMFKVLAMNNQEVMNYLKEFVETFDVKLYETIEDVLTVWLEDGRLADVVRVAISEEVIEARTDYLDHTYLNLKERLDLERKEVIDARKNQQGFMYNTLSERLNVIVDDFENKIEKIVDVVYLEDNKQLENETVSEWLSRVINSVTYGTVKAKSKKTYYIKEPILVTTSDIIIDFNGSVLASQGEVPFQFIVENADNVTIKNIFVSKIENDSGGFLSGKNLTDLTIDNIKGAITGFDKFIILQGVSRSKLSNLNIKNSNDKKKGVGLQFDYCVNIDCSSIFLEYFYQSVLFSDIKSPENYMNEGINISGLFCIKQNVGIEIYQCTQLNLSNILLDFCSDYGVYIINVNGININKYWLGLQDGGVTGIEVQDGIALSVKNGTIAGDWRKKGLQNGFYSHKNILMNVDTVYLIDINGGSLEHSKISVSNVSYFQKKQQEIVRMVYGSSVYVFDGKISNGNPFNKGEMTFSIYSFDQNNKRNFVKSEGYVDYLGIAHINKISNGGTGTVISHDVFKGYNIELKTDVDVSMYKTIVNKYVERPRINVID